MKTEAKSIIIQMHERNTENITPVLNDLRWISVPATLALYDAILILRGVAPKHLGSRLNTRASVHGRNTRNKTKLDISQRSTQLLVSALLYIER